MVTAWCNLAMKELVEIRRANLSRLVDQNGLTAVAHRMKRSVAQISDMVRGQKSFGEKVARALEREWDATLPPGWLDDETSMPQAPESNKGFPLLHKDTVIVTIPRFSTGGSMGSGIVLHDQPGVIENWQVSKTWIAQNVRRYTSIGNLCIVTGFGDSMRPTFNPGDPLIVDKGVRSVEFDSVYFFRIGGDGYVKRLQRIPTPSGLIIKALSDNSDLYMPFDITQDMDFEVLGRVVQVWRREDY